MKAVIFDLFGTLVPNLEPSVYQGAITAMSDALGCEPQSFTEVWSRGFRGRMDGSIADGDAMFVPILESIGVTPDPARLAHATQLRQKFMRSALQPKPGALECLSTLSTLGLKIGLATDCSSETPELLSETELGRKFDAQAASALVGVTKPHARMYETVLDQLGLEGTDCLYVGDGNSEELIGAKRHGMVTVWVDNGSAQYWRERFVPSGDHTIQSIPEVLDILERIAANL